MKVPNGGTYYRETRFSFEGFQESFEVFFLGRWLTEKGFDLRNPIERSIDFDTKDLIFKQEIE